MNNTSISKTQKSAKCTVSLVTRAAVTYDDKSSNCLKDTRFSGRPAAFKFNVYNNNSFKLSTHKQRKANNMEMAAATGGRCQNSYKPMSRCECMKT